MEGQMEPLSVLCPMLSLLLFIDGSVGLALVGPNSFSPYRGEASVTRTQWHLSWWQ
jgi:hypothetical protein